jgi:hypothetical protein
VDAHDARVAANVHVRGTACHRVQPRKPPRQRAGVCDGVDVCNGCAHISCAEDGAQVRVLLRSIGAEQRRERLQRNNKRRASVFVFMVIDVCAHS